MKIIYTINGREASWCVSSRDKYELQRIMNDINIDDLAYAIWDKAAPDDYEDQINNAFC